ncbi:MAG: hypothetical protein PHF84_07575 [bacterium]|nr:hypothetical protein [bacterium]
MNVPGSPDETQVAARAGYKKEKAKEQNKDQYSRDDPPALFQGPDPMQKQ